MAAHIPFNGLFAERRKGSAISVAVTCLVVAGVAFGLLAATVASGAANRLDHGVLALLRVDGDPHRLVGPAWLRLAASDITALGSTSVTGFFAALVMGLMLTLRRRREALFVLVVVTGGQALNHALKALVDRPRPEISFRAVEVAHPSFPSGHATQSTVLVLLLAVLVVRFGARQAVWTYVLAAGAVMAVLVGLSRIYLGVHWASDVIGGWCVGVSWVSLCWLIAAGILALQEPSPAGR